MEQKEGLLWSRIILFDIPDHKNTAEMGVLKNHENHIGAFQQEAVVLIIESTHAHDH